MIESTEAVLETPTDLEGLGFHEGDRVVGHIRDGKIVLEVPEATEERDAFKGGFGSRWRGKFSDLKDRDFSDDPRAERILGR